MRKLIVSGTAIAIVIVSIVLFKLFSGMGKPPEPAKVYESVKYVNTTLVEYSDNGAVISATGRARSADRIEVYPEVSGILLVGKPEFKKGAFFTKGSTMMKIDDREIRLNIKSMRSDFLNALTLIMADLKSDFPKEFGKWKNYLDNISIESVLPELPEIKDSKEKYFIAGRNILKLFYNIRAQELRLEKHEIKAPFSGVVIQALAEPGTMLRAGMKAGEFAGTAEYEIELPIPESEIGMIDMNSPVLLISENEGKSAKGYIKRISRHIDPGTQTLTVFAGTSAPWIKDGMYLRAEIGGEDVKASFVVPRSALFNNTFVHVIKNGTLERMKVEVIFRGANQAFIRGLDEGTVVITDPIVNAALGINVRAIDKTNN